jgi:hypothetical protein
LFSLLFLKSIGRANETAHVSGGEEYEQRQTQDDEDNSKTGGRRHGDTNPSQESHIRSHADGALWQERQRGARNNPTGNLTGAEPSRLGALRIAIARSRPNLATGVSVHNPHG